jgi:hypothetical protein
MEPMQPVPVSVVPDARPREVVIISHSPLFYWWPVWLVGFLMAAVSFWYGDQVAFVPTGTVAERGARLEGHEGRRDILIVPAGQSLSGTDDSGDAGGRRWRPGTSSSEKLRPACQPLARAEKVGRFLSCDF